jgi:hypothetical protein
VSVSALRVSRANGSRSPRSQDAAGNREAALLAANDPLRNERRDRLAQQYLLAEAADAVPGRESRREAGEGGVEERHARFERVRHRGAVGLHEEVVCEVDPEVDVLQAGERLGPSVSAKRRAVEVHGVEPVPSPRELGARVGGEDLLPGVVALQRRQVRPRTNRFAL